MIENLVSRNTVFIKESFDSKEALFRYLSHQLFLNQKIKDENDFFQGLLERESIITTGIGGGIAIPHTKNKSVISPFVGFLKLTKGMSYEALDHKNVDLIFVIGVGDNAERLHLEILANLSRYLLDEEFSKALRETNDPQILYETLKIVESEKKIWT